MVQINKRFIALLSFSAVALATVSQIEADIANISSKVAALDTLITTFPTTGGTLSAALAIHVSTEALISTIKTATVDVTATGAVSVTDGTTILHSVETAEPIILNALTGIVAKKAAFVALALGGVPKLVYLDLTYLSGNATLFANSLIKNCPSSLVAEATAAKNNMASALSVAVSAYAVYA